MKTTLQYGRLELVTVEFDEFDIKRALLDLARKENQGAVISLNNTSWEFDHPRWDYDNEQPVGAYTATLTMRLEKIDTTESVTGT